MIDGFGWYYIVIVSLFVVFAIWLGLGRFGDIPLGEDGEQAEYSIGAWLSIDSGALVVNMLSSGGNPEPPTWSRAFWTCAQGAVAAALLVASGTGTAALTTLQTVAILIALPFSVVLLAMCVALVKTFRADRGS